MCALNFNSFSFSAHTTHTDGIKTINSVFSICRYILHSSAIKYYFVYVLLYATFFLFRPFTSFIVFSEVYIRNYIFNVKLTLRISTKISANNHKCYRKSLHQERFFLCIDAANNFSLNSLIWVS